MIEAKGLKKSFGRNLAVDDVSFTVNEGEIVAFVGPNGAGKTTALRMLSTFLPPDSGVATVNGYDILKDPFSVRLNIGYMPENSIAYEGMRVDRFLKFVGTARQLKGTRLREQFEWVVKTFKLEMVMHKKVGQCSKGFRRRVSMAMALIHDPPVLLLDEPTHGLDPLQVLALREFIISLKSEKAILFSSHIFQEVTAICDRVLIINNGRLLADGTITQLSLKSGHKPVMDCVLQAPFPQLKDAVADLKNGEVLRMADEGGGAVSVELETTSDGLDNEIRKLALEREWQVDSLETRPLNLEQIFADIVRESGSGVPGYA
ncbi:ABC transporter ATP-binding protein [bacterium]